MTRSHPHKGKYERNDQVPQDDFLEGTSARTRPLSFDDIMHARKNKASATKPGTADTGVIDIALAQDEKPCSPESHKRTNEDSGSIYNRLTFEDSQKLNSSRKGDNNASRENRKLVFGKDKGSWETHPKLKSVVDKNISSDRVTEAKFEKHHQSYKERKNREKEGSLSDHSDYGLDKRQSRVSDRKDKVSEVRRGKSEIAQKQLHNEDRRVSRKRKTDGRMSSDPEIKKQNARVVISTDKLTDRGRDKSEKEVRHKLHNEEDRQRGRITGKKHGSERKGVESTRAYHEESRSKRRRSQSRERMKERSGRSLSQSPKAPKQTFRDKREQGELLSNSTKDRSGKENPDVDKKISSNGSSYQYRRNSSSGLGGYSPRKRKTDAAAKTPSPTHRSPARRTAGWDFQRVEKESAIGDSTFVDIHTSLNLSMNVQESPSVTLVTPIVMKPIGVSPQTLSSQMHAVESIQLTQATRPMRRLYVENLPASASEKDLIECINNFFLSSGINHIQGTQPCISCIIHKEKGQALLEFLTPEDASAALSFDGISFSGSKLKLRRPKDYATITTGVPDKSLVASDSISGDVEDSPHKIFIGGISKFFSSKMLLEIAKAFGPVKAFRFEFIADNETRAFLEYVDHSVTSKACAGLNGMKLGGKVLTAVFATPDAVTEHVGKQPFYGIPEHAKPLLEEPSAVLKLKNALDPEGLLSLSESELEEILEDIRIECSRFGTVKSVNVARPIDSLGGMMDARGTKTTDESMDRSNVESENRNSAKVTLREGISDSAVFDWSEPQEAPNELERSCQALGSSNACDESSGINKLPTETEDISRAKVVGGSSSEEIMVDNVVKDETCELPRDDENTSAKERSSQEDTGGTGEPVSQQSPSANELERNDNTAGSVSPGNVEMEEQPEELKLEEDNTKDTSSVELVSGERKELDAPDPDSKKDASIDLGTVFETGSVFVEYRRAEAACMASHSLHGRLFDGRVITVGYISHKLYQLRFHK